MIDIGEARFEKVRLDELVTDWRFNRPVRNNHVEKIAVNFNAAAFGVIELWKREDGGLVILDGQHRKHAAEMRGISRDVKCIPALIHEDLTLSQAAELFVQLNASKLVSAYDKFHALRTAGHETTVDINRIVEAEGLRVVGSSSSSDGTVGAVAALQHVYRLGEPPGVVLTLTLRALTATWGGASEAYRSQLLRGVGLYFHRHRDTDPQILADALGRGPGAPINLQTWAKLVAGTTRMPLDQAIAITIEERVMKKKRARPKAV